jgi:hypothetical protein
MFKYTHLKTNLEINMKYTPEIIISGIILIYNMTLIISCAWGIVSLYKESHSFHSLWLLVMLLAIKSHSFIRD